jgi:methylenetetrahydrofolate dehydrogenase (NADP+)/methenyltetrahydrofolate cyclohydrolase
MGQMPRIFIGCRPWYNSPVLTLTLLKHPGEKPNGYALAAAREPGLAARAQQLIAAGKPPVIAAILFTEDAGSILYTGLKREAAARLGIGYHVYAFSQADDSAQVIAKVQELNQDPTVTGIIIQKPGRGLRSPAEYKAWWQPLIMAIDPAKDVDGLTPSTLAKVQANTWQGSGVVLPATCRAVLVLLKEYTRLFELEPAAKTDISIAVLGRSELLGLPLTAELKNQGYQVNLLGKQDLIDLIEQKKYLQKYDLVISATGQPKLITGDWLKPGAIVIDVGEPKGDVDFASASQVASLVTPVPGGVGPLTVSCLMENSLDLGFLT